MTKEKLEKTISLLKGVLDYESFTDVDMVIEVPLAAFLLSCVVKVPFSPPGLWSIVDVGFGVLETGCY